MKLGKIVTYPGLEYVSLCGSILCSLCMISGFGVKGGHVVGTGCIFLWCDLSATVSVEGKAGFGVPGARAGFELGILLGSMVGVGLGLKRLEHEL